jgi:hypothetical protein
MTVRRASHGSTRAELSVLTHMRERTALDTRACCCPRRADSRGPRFASLWRGHPTRERSHASRARAGASRRPSRLVRQRTPSHALTSEGSTPPSGLGLRRAIITSRRGEHVRCRDHPSVRGAHPSAHLPESSARGRASRTRCPLDRTDRSDDRAVCIASPATNSDEPLTLREHTDPIIASHRPACWENRTATSISLPSTRRSSPPNLGSLPPKIRSRRPSTRSIACESSLIRE